MSEGQPLEDSYFDRKLAVEKRSQNVLNLAKFPQLK